MTTIKNTTKAGKAIISDLYRNGEANIFEAYGRPSIYKINAFKEIENRANNTPGYNHDLHICGAGSHFFSTVYSYTNESGDLVIVKDTASNTYMVTIPAESENIA